jgi:heme/copper-type cytochrome/quinol oxidase subunit 2
MYSINPLLLLILPLIFQLIFGRKAIAESIKLSFFQTSLISFISQFVLSYLAIKILSHNLRNANGEIHCGMPLMALTFLELLVFIILLIIIMIQYFIKRRYQKRIDNL